MWIFGSTIPEKNRQSDFPKPPDYPIVVRKPCSKPVHCPHRHGAPGLRRSPAALRTGPSMDRALLPIQRQPLKQPAPIIPNRSILGEILIESSVARETA